MWTRNGFIEQGYETNAIALCWKFSYNYQKIGGVDLVDMFVGLLAYLMVWFFLCHCILRVDGRRAGWMYLLGTVLGLILTVDLGRLFIP